MCSALWQYGRSTREKRLEAENHMTKKWPCSQQEGHREMKISSIACNDGPLKKSSWRWEEVGGLGAVAAFVHTSLSEDKASPQLEE